MNEKNIKKYDFIVIGGGPAGLMAAIRAGERGRKVLLLDKNTELGKKLLITGGGRCNLTNMNDCDYFLKKFSQTGIFLRNIFVKFFNTDLLNLFIDNGLEFKEEKDGCVFPATDNAHDILSILKLKLKSNNIDLMPGEIIQDVLIKDNCLKKVIAFSGREYYAHSLLLATGGLSYPKTGSTGDGYKFAEKLGHKIIELKSALVPIEIKENFIKDWQGISLKDIGMVVFKNDKKFSTERGDLLFTHFGLSGPAVLNLSADIYDIVESGNNASVSINFMPELECKQLHQVLLDRFKKEPNRQIKKMLYDILPQNMVEQFLRICNIQCDKKSNQLTAEARKILVNNLLGLKLNVKTVRPISEAIITRGGVCTDEINPKTMESKLVKGLFFAGEIIDIDAKTGGYNLQAAFSTGWVSGDSV